MEDDHTGVGDAGGVPYTYEHVEEPPTSSADLYRVTAFIEFTDRPIHKNVYYVEAAQLDEWLLGRGEVGGERIVDIRPTTQEEAERRMAEYRGEST